MGAVLGVLPTVLLSIMLLIMGLISKKFPSQYGNNTGYNTVQSRKSEKVWNYAQQLAVKYAFKFSLLSVLISGIWMLICVGLAGKEIGNTSSYVIVNLVMAIFILIFMFVRVEVSLKNHE